MILQNYPIITIFGISSFEKHCQAKFFEMLIQILIYYFLLRFFEKPEWSLYLRTFCFTYFLAFHHLKKVLQFIDLEISFNCSDIHGEVCQCIVRGSSGVAFILLIFFLGLNLIIKIMMAYNMYIYSINFIQETLIGYLWQREESNLHARIIELEKNLDSAKQRLGMGEDQTEMFFKSASAEDKRVC